MYWDIFVYKMLDRNRRASASLSPVFIHFISPSSYLSQKLQHLLAQLQTDGNAPLPLITQRRPGPAKPKHSIPPTEWSTVQQCNGVFWKTRNRCAKLPVIMGFLMKPFVVFFLPTARNLGIGQIAPHLKNISHKQEDAQWFQKVLVYQRHLKGS